MKSVFWDLTLKWIKLWLTLSTCTWNLKKFSQKSQFLPWYLKAIGRWEQNELKFSAKTHELVLTVCFCCTYVVLHWCWRGAIHSRKCCFLSFSRRVCHVFSFGNDCCYSTQVHFSEDLWKDLLKFKKFKVDGVLCYCYECSKAPVVTSCDSCRVNDLFMSHVDENTM